MSRMLNSYTTPCEHCAEFNMCLSICRVFESGHFRFTVQSRYRAPVNLHTLRQYFPNHSTLYSLNILHPWPLQ